MEYVSDTLQIHYTTDPVPEAGIFSRHAHRQYEILYFMGGEARCIIEQHQHTLREGELILIPPRAYHFIKILGPAPYRRTVLNFDRCDVRPEVLNALFREPTVIDSAKSPELAALFARLHRYLERFHGEDRRRLAENLLTELVYLLDDCEGDRVRDDYRSDLPEQALRYIEEHLTEIRSAEEISRALFISRSRLYAVFTESFGLPPMGYLNEKRLLAADARIALGEKPARAAAACGFGDYSAFYRAYKKRFGHSPKEQRN